MPAFQHARYEEMDRAGLVHAEAHAKQLDDGLGENPLVTFLSPRGNGVA